MSITAPVFVDSNVLIYAVDVLTFKKQQATRLAGRTMEEPSRVAQEFYAKISNTSPTA